MAARPNVPTHRGFSSRAPATDPTCGAASQQSGEPNVFSFFENATSTWQYIVADPATNKAVIIDPVLDYSPASGVISTTTADGLLSFVEKNALDVVMLLETHAHADHLTAAQYLKHRLGGQVPVAIGKRIVDVQKTFSKVYGLTEDKFVGAFDKLWEDDERFNVGNLEFDVVHLPGHTPDHVGYMTGKALFLGDTLFYPDVGSARADFPGGSPTDLYRSVQRVLAMDPDVRIYSGHDYPPDGAKPGERCWSLVSEQREKNIHLKANPTFSETNALETTSEGAMNAFIKWREQRDKSLGAPRLLHPSLQVNVCGGRLPDPDETGRRSFKIPLKIPEGL